MRFLIVQLVLFFSTVTCAEPLHVVINGADQFTDTVGSIDSYSTTSNYTEIEVTSEAAQSSDLASLIKNTVGLEIQQSSGLGSFSSVSLRAASSEQVMVYLDGILLNDSISGHVDLSLIPISQVERIDIYRGSTPVELGGASIGGAINIITHNGSEEIKIIGATAGSFGVAKANLHWTKKDQKNLFRFISEIIDNKNKYPIINDNGTIYVTSDDREESRNHAATAQVSSLFTWKYIQDANYTWLHTVRLFDKSQDLPNLTNSEDVTTTFDTKLIQLNSKISIKRILQTEMQSSFEMYLRNKEEIYDDRLSQIGLKSNWLLQESQIVGLKGYLQNKIDDTELRVVFDIDEQNSLSEDLSDVLDDVTHHRKTARLNLGVRQFYKDGSVLNLDYAAETIRDQLDDAYDIYENSIPAQNRNYDFGEVRIGYMGYLTRNTKLKINVGQYHRVPYLFELYGDRGFFHGNSDLQAEESVNFDIGLDYLYKSGNSLFDNLTLYLGLYNNRSNNLIVRTFNAQGVGVSRNISDANIRGLETTANWPFIKNHQLGFRMSLIRSEIISDEAGFDGNVIPGRFVESYFLSYSIQHYSWTAQLEYVVKQGMYYDRANLLRAEDRELVNLEVTRKQGEHSFLFSIKNMFDHRYEDYNGYPKPGRILYLGYAYQF